MTEPKPTDETEQRLVNDVNYICNECGVGLFDSVKRATILKAVRHLIARATTELQAENEALRSRLDIALHPTQETSPSQPITGEPNQDWT